MPVSFATSMLHTLVGHAPKDVVSARLITPEMTTDTFANYIAYRKKTGMLSFLPAGKEHVVDPEDGDWKKDNRQEMKPARLARQLLTKEAQADLRDKDFEAFANRIKGIEEVEAGEFAIIQGEDIYHWYPQDMSKLGGYSCMTGVRRERLEFYVVNPSISVLILKRGDRLAGRGLLWTATDGKRYLDRVYGSDATRRAIIDYAEDQGFEHFYEYQGGTGQSFVVDLAVSDVAGCPYMDSLRYIDYANKQISNDRRLLKGRINTPGDGQAGYLYCRKCEAGYLPHLADPAHEGLCRDCVKKLTWVPCGECRQLANPKQMYDGSNGSEGERVCHNCFALREHPICPDCRRRQIPSWGDVHYGRNSNWNTEKGKCAACAKLEHVENCQVCGQKDPYRRDYKTYQIKHGWCYGCRRNYPDRYKQHAKEKANEKRRATRAAKRAANAIPVAAD